MASYINGLLLEVEIVPLLPDLERRFEIRKVEIRDSIASSCSYSLVFVYTIPVIFIFNNCVVCSAVEGLGQQRPDLCLEGIHKELPLFLLQSGHV